MARITKNNCFNPILDYALSTTENDENTVKPIHINLQSQKLFRKHLKYFNHIKLLAKLDGVVGWNQYSPADLEWAKLLFPNNIYEGFPWDSVEIINMENNIINNKIVQDTTSFVRSNDLTNKICYLVFDYLKFFDLTKVQRISSHFQEPIIEHLYRKYGSPKADLFVNFNLKKFLMEIDNDSDNQSAKVITIYELRFIFKHFGHHMKSVEIQTEHLKKTRDTVTTDEFKIIVQIINEILYEFVIGKLLFLKIDYIHLNNLCIDEHIYDMYNRDVFQINNEILPILLQTKYIQELNILAEYPQIDRNDMIELLKNIQLKKINIKSYAQHRNRNCDDFIDALRVNSLNTLEVIHINSCRSERFFELINYFINLKEIVIDDLICCGNFGNYLINSLNLPNLEKLRLLNFDFVDDYLCFELVKKNKSLKYLDISNCDNVVGTFINEINKGLEQRLIIIDSPLHINLTNIKRKLMYSKEELKATNEKLILSSDYFEIYSNDKVKDVIQSLEDDINTDQYELNEIPRMNLLPITFLTILRNYFSSYHLDLRNYYHLNESCLNTISSYCHINQITLNTYYPKVENVKILEVLKKYQINAINVYGGEESPNIYHNSCDIIKEFITSSAITLTRIKICDCSLDENFIRTINSYTNLHNITLDNVSGLLNQGFRELRLPNLESLQLKNCIELEDKMCVHIIQSCPTLKKLNISKCNNLVGTFLRDARCDKRIEYQNPITIHLDETPVSIMYFKRKIVGTNTQFVTCSFGPNFELFKSLYKLKLTKDAEEELLINMKNFDLTNCDERDSTLFNNTYFARLFQMKLLSNLKLSSFYQNVSILRDLFVLNISHLELSNDKILENDLTTDILCNFAKYNATHLKTIKLTKCKINEQTIISINQLKQVNILSFESVVGLKNDLIEKLLIGKLEELHIIKNDDVEDAQCLKMIRDNQNLKYFDVSKCEKITEFLFKELNEISAIQTVTTRIDVSCTKAGYYYLLNMEKYFYNLNIEYMSYAANKYYLSKILLEDKLNPVTSLPSYLIILNDPLDLRGFTEINDLSFLLISQLQYVPEVMINAFYQKVIDKENMIENLLKMNFTQLIIDGNFNSSPLSMNSNCDYIVRGLSNRPNRIRTIIILNCIISSDLINSLSEFKYLEVISIRNENVNYLKKVIEEFKFSKSSISVLNVNNEKINNNYNDINTLKKKLQLI